MTVLTAQTKARLMRDGLKKLYVEADTQSKRDAAHKALRDTDGDDDIAAALYDAINQS